LENFFAEECNWSVWSRSGACREVGPDKDIRSGAGWNARWQRAVGRLATMGNGNTNRGLKSTIELWLTIWVFEWRTAVCRFAFPAG